ncbi:MULTISPECIES: collagen-like triple helix repeat-containing protein [Niastella]|uniref:Collagen-like protein n=1 Tax=Niastella soli TaxID=2821487 RepID=A0ABS3Z196_9BACT|nr:collagen-like protein [Niastella soli]MBO9203171.1 collagen-like protein [Niastella soli]
MKRTHQWGKHHFLYYLLAATLLVGACKKGDPGPQGAKGDKGDTGATGEKGAAGNKGDAGTANVIYSDWLDVSFVSQSGGGFFAQIQEAKVTDDLLSKGEIKVYLNLGTAAEKFVIALPFLSGTTQITPFYEPGLIEMASNANVGTITDQASGSKVQQYRYVLIPGGTHARMDKQINWNNYEEVKNYLGLKD